MVEKIIEADLNISLKLKIPEKAKILRAAAAFFAHSGDSWFWMAGVCLIWLVTQGRWHQYSALFAIAILIQASLTLGIKFMIKRQRPEGKWGYVYRKTDPHSFPSGHAVRAAMLVVMAWSLQLSPLNWILTLWAPLVSLARVSLGVHYFIDVLAGWLFGIALAFAILAAQPLLYQAFPFLF